MKKLQATRAAMILFRTASKNSKSTTIGVRVALTPSIGLGIRQDGGDAEVNRAPDVSLGLVLADGVRGVTVDGRMRRLPVHKAAEFAEHDIGGSVSSNPTAKTPTGVAGLISRRKVSRRSIEASRESRPRP